MRNKTAPQSSVPDKEIQTAPCLDYSGILLGALVVFAQDHRTVVNEHGDHVMGFSHDETTHHFQLHYDGGVIDVRADDLKDTESRNQIREHFQHIAQMFSDGNFNAPMLVHGVAVPGTAMMTKLKDQLHWSLEETSRGARFVVVADNKPALDAVHEFLRFQNSRPPNG